MIPDAGWGADFVEPLLDPLVEGPEVNEAPPTACIWSSQQGRPDKAFADESLEVAFRKSAMLSRTFECGPSGFLSFIQFTVSEKGIAPTSTALAFIRSRAD